MKRTDIPEADGGMQNGPSESLPPSVTNTRYTTGRDESMGEGGGHFVVSQILSQVRDSEKKAWCYFPSSLTNDLVTKDKTCKVLVFFSYLFVTFFF